ncbi:hypothetical protein I7I53_01710 [Histoplasma capsulatum var. duboisii H88]|uniref:Ankyrin repeat protein n=1 Tax=Ajellomyces capsulatus (strain H88) TaxID=544711 RepID=A0A8A1LK43_AJEC8|nr:hypothetical protein I7I53_01710 [Histoplasma capsulatum var. duboisii H88]
MLQLLSCAVSLGHASLINSLIQVCMAFDDLGRILQSHGLLLIAISDNQLELASHILDTGLTLEKFPFYPDVIAKKGLDEMLKLLLLRGMRLDNIRSWRWYSLLEGAVEEGNTALVKLLVGN